MRRRTKVGIGAAFVLLVLTAVGIGLSAGEGGAIQVRVEEVGERDLVATVVGNGWIRPSRSVDVQADIMGRVETLHVREGESVSRGQLLLRIDPTQYEAAVSRAQASVSEARAGESQARASLLQARRTLERSEALAEADADLISEQQLEQARSEVEVQTALYQAAEFRVAQAVAALRESQNQLDKTTITAPIDGVVTRLNVDEGETAIVGTMNNPGSLLLTVSDLSLVEAVVRVDETDLPDVEVGDSASIEIDAFPRRTFTGEVFEIAHSALMRPEDVAQRGGPAQAVDYQVVIRLDQPPPQLRPDFSATAEVVTAVRENVLAIPIIALTVRGLDTEPLPQEEPEAQAAAQRLAESGGEQEGVFVVRDGEIHFVPVTIGIAGREHFEVVRGLAAGDSLVAGPYEAIRELEEGSEITILAGDSAGARQENTDT